MNEKHDEFFRQTTRFALPAIILMFYVTATLHFDYTPDSSYLELLRAGHRMTADGTTPPVPWTILMMLGEQVHLDPLLVAKVLSLFFSCVVIMFGFLVAQQILMDRLLAFSMALLTAVQPGLLQLAVSGSAMPLAAALTLATLFFMLRNEYLLAAILAGVCGLTYWQGALLLLFVAVDVLVNSFDVRRGIKVASTVLMIGIATWLPWVLYSLLKGDGELVPVVTPVEHLQPHVLLLVVVLALPGLLILPAIVLGLRASKEIRSLLRMHAVSFAFLVWLGAVALPDLTMAIAALPVFFVYTVLSLRVVLMATNSERFHYAMSVVFVGLMLVAGQWDFYSRMVPSMKAATVESQELIAIAYWVRSHTDESDTIASERAAILAYYSGRDVLIRTDGQWDIIVAASEPGAEYRMAFDPVAEHPWEFIGSATRWKVWRRS